MDANIAAEILRGRAVAEANGLPNLAQNYVLLKCIEHETGVDLFKDMMVLVEVVSILCPVDEDHVTRMTHAVCFCRLLKDEADPLDPAVIAPQLKRIAANVLMLSVKEGRA